MIGDPSQPRPSEDAIVEYGVLRNLRSDAAQALLLLGELRSLTGWDDDTLCAQLGCHPETWMVVGGRANTYKDKDKDKTDLDHSLRFLKLIREVTGRLDLTRHRREVVNAAFTACADAGGVVPERVPRILAALEERSDGDLTPSELLNLGEIGKAWRQVALNMRSGRAYERSTATAKLTAPLQSHTAHLSPERLTLLAQPNAEDLLGSRVAVSMRKHLSAPGCAKCRRVAQEMGLTELLRTADLHQAAAA
ncbi:MAG TPA: hypothetical protein VGI24_10545 [Solirubrobacteraceae bacterium]|jgi:hypothetical protein